MKLRFCTLFCALCFTPWLHAQLSGPQGILFDADGKLWVANSSTNQVQKLDPSTGEVLAIITAGLDGPNRPAFGTYGDLYVANMVGNTITVYDCQLNQIQAKTISTNLSRPTGVSVDAYGDVFVSNNATNDIVVFNVDGTLVETLAKDNGSLSFTAPNALVIHETRLFVSVGPTSGKNTVITYNPGEFLTNNPQPRGQFSDFTNTGPTGVAFDNSDNVYVADYYSNSWVKFSPNGKLLLVVTTGVLQPEGIAVDHQGNVFVANSTPNTITVYNPQGSLIRTLK